ncbi:sugar ABC transporter substrate-binding protein [Okibacterium endophyticum]
MFRRTLAATGMAAASAFALVGCAIAAPAQSEETTITFRLWDETVAEGYEQSFEAFEEQNPTITVNVNVVDWADYWTQLRTDVADKTMDDVYWLNNSYFEAYADGNKLVDVSAAVGADAAQDWEPSVVDEFTRDDVLWGVPQLYDAGSAVYYNADLLEAADVSAETLRDLEWSPDPQKDTFLPVAQQLTVDAAGVNAATEGFDGTPVQYGTNIGYDLQAILLPYIGSNGGDFQDGERFAFAGSKSVEAVSYLVNAIHTAKVAPSATETNDDSDFSRDQFVQGNMAMFQSGLYNLKHIADEAAFEWGVAPIPAGPEGRVSVTNGIIAAGNADSEHPAAVKQVLAWLGSAEGNAYLGESGAAVPAVKSAQKTYFDYWEQQDIELDPFFDVIDKNDSIPAPAGSSFEAGFEAYDPIVRQVFAGELEPASGLQRAQDAANAAITR